MSTRSSQDDTPLTDRRRIVLVSDPRAELGDKTVIEYPMSPLSEAGYRHSRQRILSARQRIKANGGKCRYEDIDENAGRSGADWAKPLIKSTSSKWSFNEARWLADALKKCEIARATEALCKVNDGISKKELQRRYADFCNRATTSNLRGILIEPEKELPYESWLALNADQDTLRELHELTFTLYCRQVWAQRSPGQCKCAAVIARCLVDEGVVAGERKFKFTRAYDAVIKSFAETEIQVNCDLRWQNGSG